MKKYLLLSAVALLGIVQAAEQPEDRDANPNPIQSEIRQYSDELKGLELGVQLQMGVCSKEAALRFCGTLPKTVQEQMGFYDNHWIYEPKK